jgi:hypothetical protein
MTRGNKQQIDQAQVDEYVDMCVADRAQGINYAGFRCKTNACENDIKIPEEGHT